MSSIHLRPSGDSKTARPSLDRQSAFLTSRSTRDRSVGSIPPSDKRCRTALNPPNQRSAADDLLQYVKRNYDSEPVSVYASDGSVRKVSRVLLCARSKVFEAMLQHSRFAEAKTHCIRLGEDAALVDAFMEALVHDRCPLIKALQNELENPTDVVCPNTPELRRIFDPLLPAKHNDEAISTDVIDLRQKLLGTILELLVMAQKYEFLNLTLTIENGLNNMDLRLWGEPKLVLGVLRIVATFGGNAWILEARCKESLQNFRGGDLLAWMTGDPLGFWARTRSQRINVVSHRTQEPLVTLTVSPTDSVLFVKELLCRDDANERIVLAAVECPFSRLHPRYIQLLHQHTLLDSRKTLGEYVIAKDDTLAVRMLPGLRRSRRRCSTSVDRTFAPC